MSLIAADGPPAVTEPVAMAVLAPAPQRPAGSRPAPACCSRARWGPFDATAVVEAATRIHRRCRDAGITPRGLLDCMIAAVAWRREASLLAYDADLLGVAIVIDVELDEASLLK